MKLLMDADCLIKLTKAGLKELVAANDSISIPKPVKREVVDAGKKKQCADAIAVEKNIESKMISVIDAPAQIEKGDQALISMYREEDYDAIATDDTKLSRQLKSLNIPFILPALVLYRLLKESKIDYKTILWALQQLSEFNQAINYVSQLEKIEKTQSLRKLARIGFEYYVAKNYKEGRITLRDASDLLKLSMSEAMDLLAEMGVKGNIRAADVYASLMTFAPLD
jgi:rRNA-processing protein FCF1/predicted HTH domain antitoxin